MSDMLKALLEIEEAATKEYETVASPEHHRSIERILAVVGKHRTPLTPPGIDLRELGFVGRVSDGARREIAERARKSGVVPL